MDLLQGTLLLIAYALLTGCALRAVFTGRYRTATWLIFTLALLLRVFMAGDLFLHEWDERFHAVIAKNIWSSPFAPRLYTDGVLTYDFARWSESDLWLSKPFLPFWVMGGSIALFGSNEFGLRLPSVLIGLVSVWVTLRLGTELFGRKPGLVAAFLHAIHGMVLEMSGGLISSDHVDTLFTLLFQLGLWAYVRSWSNRATWRFLLVGFLVGLAFLTKWVMAFFVLPVLAGVHWGKRKSLRAFSCDLALVGVGFLVTTLPWMVYLYRHFPEEITLIFTQFLGRSGASFEGHGGGFFFYFEDALILFGAGALVAVGWVSCVAVRKLRPRHLLLFLWIVLPLTLLTFMSTKRSTYLIMSAPAYFLTTALCACWLVRQPWKPWGRIVAVSLLLGLPVQYSVERLKPFAPRFVWPEWRLNFERHITRTVQVSGVLAPGQPVVLQKESRPFHVMFYRDDIIAYPRVLRPEEITRLERAGFHVVPYEGADAGAGER